MCIFAARINREIFNLLTTKKQKNDCALKKFKRKFEKTGIIKELRNRQQFDKPSVIKRLKKEHAVYVQKLQQVED